MGDCKLHRKSSAFIEGPAKQKGWPEGPGYVTSLCFIGMGQQESFADDPEGSKPGGPHAWRSGDVLHPHPQEQAWTNSTRVAETRTPHQPVWVSTRAQCPAQQRLMWTGDQREPDVLPGCSEACFLTPVGYHHLEGGQPEATEIVTKVEWGVVNGKISFSLFPI